MLQWRKTDTSAADQIQEGLDVLAESFCSAHKAHAFEIICAQIW